MNWKFEKPYVAGQRFPAWLLNCSLNFVLGEKETVEVLAASVTALLTGPQHAWPVQNAVVAPREVGPGHVLQLQFQLQLSRASVEEIEKARTADGAVRIEGYADIVSELKREVRLPRPSSGHAQTQFSVLRESDRLHSDQQRFEIVLNRDQWLGGPEGDRLERVRSVRVAAATC